MDREQVKSLMRQGNVLRWTALALAEGLDVTTDSVRQHYQRFREWNDAEISTAYLMRVTGITRKAGE